MISKENLEVQLASLLKEKEAHQKDLLMVEGAISLCNHLIAMAKQLEADAAAPPPN